MTQKILLIDWKFISSDSGRWIGFPEENFSVKRWLDTGEYESKAMNLYDNMRTSSVFSTQPSDRPIRWLISMFSWFYFKQKDYLGVDRYGEGLEDVYSIDPGLVEYLYNEYQQYCLERFTITINDQIQRLIVRKPGDWELGIVSFDRTSEEIELILSDKFCYAKGCNEAFTYKFCTDSPIRFFELPPTIVNVQFVSENIGIYNFGCESDVYILSNAEIKRHLHPNNIDVIEVWGGKTIDDFDFNNPGKVLVESNTEKVSENAENDPNKIAYPHDIVMGKFPFIQKIIDFIKDEGGLLGGSVIAYSLLVVLILTMSEWLGLIDSAEDVIFYTLAVPFLSWFAVMLLIIVFLLITTVPVDAMNRYYKNKETGLDTWDATWKAIKPVIMWTTILILLGYIF